MIAPQYLHWKVYEYIWRAQSKNDPLIFFSAIFESVHMPKFSYFWTLSKMAEKSRDRSCSEPFICAHFFLYQPCFSWLVSTDSKCRPWITILTTILFKQVYYPLLFKSVGKYTLTLQSQNSILLLGTVQRYTQSHNKLSWSRFSFNLIMSMNCVT